MYGVHRERWFRRAWCDGRRDCFAADRGWTYRHRLESYNKLLAVSGLPKIRFHDLRHTATSLMLNHGIPVLIVSKRLGNSKPSITIDVYGHRIPSRQEEAAQLMDNLLFDG